MSLSLYEQETIINFNKEEKTASIFTYEKTWQRHLEKRLGLKPVMDNGHGGREYQIDKKRIPMPRAPMKLSPEARAKLSKRMAEANRKRILSREKPVITGKSNNKTSRK
jgi:hypothetical protein